MKPDALRTLAGQIRRDPNPDAIEDAAAALDAVAAMFEAGEHQARAGETLAEPAGRIWTDERKNAWTAETFSEANEMARRRPGNCAALNLADDSWAVRDPETGDCGLPTKARPRPGRRNDERCPPMRPERLGSGRERGRAYAGMGRRRRDMMAAPPRRTP